MMRRLFGLIGVVASLGAVAADGYAVAPESSATPTVMHAATPDNGVTLHTVVIAELGIKIEIAPCATKEVVQPIE